MVVIYEWLLWISAVGNDEHNRIKMIRNVPLQEFLKYLRSLSDFNVQASSLLLSVRVWHVQIMHFPSSSFVLFQGISWTLQFGSPY